MAERVRRQPRAQTREQLLHAAERVFAQRGFHGASVENISREAGLSTGALYSNFAGKEELFLSLYEERVERRRRELRAAVDEAGGGAAGLASAAASVGEAFEQDADWFLLYFEFALYAARDRDFAQRFGAVREEGLTELAAGIADGLEHAGLGDVADRLELARGLRALSYGLALDGLVEDDAAPGEVFARMLKLIFQGLRGASA